MQFSPVPMPSEPSRLPPGMDRRGFLRLSAGGTAAIAAAALLPSGCAASYPQAEADGIRLQALSPKEYAVARAAAESFLVDVPVEPAAIAARIDSELALVGDPIREDMKTVLGLVEHLTPMSGHLRRFTSLSVEDRLRYLAGWRESRLRLRRGAYTALKAFIYFFAYADNATRPLTGFRGPWPELVQIPAYPVDFGPVA